MRSRILTTGILFLLAGTVQAVTPPKPEKCPSVSAIASVGVQDADTYEGHWLGWSLGSHYNTNEEWGFIIGFFDAKDKTKAIMQANEAVPSLQYHDGPVYDSGSGKWGCNYISPNGHFGTAFTPSYGKTTSTINVFK